jgi:uncharacterized protein
MPDGPARFRNSRYNFAVQVRTGTLIYNARTGAAQQLKGADAVALGRALAGPPADFPVGAVGGAVLGHLITGGFLVPAGWDELAEVRQRYWRAREDTPAVLTLTTTMDCNLRCYYCYENRSGDRLTLRDIPSVVAIARDRLRSGGRRALHVDWYGGEPLLNLEFMEEASVALQTFCEQEGVAYQASVISNRTRWPDDVGGFVRRHHIRQVQISFDGLRRNHDRRRRYGEGHVPGPGASSFDQAIRLATELLNHVRVDVRLNIDRGNRADLIPFVRLARSLGWFRARYPAVLQPARLAAYSPRSRFLRRAELSLSEFDALKAGLRDEIAGEASVEESEAPDGLPRPRASVCAALAHGSVVVGADGLQYRCGLQVGEPGRAVSGAGGGRLVPLPLLGDSTDDVWWRRFDPTELPTCSRCSFLPICWGGCPKKHLEGDEHAIAEQGAYWRANLPRLVAQGVGMELVGPSDFGLSDQFRP